MNDYESDYVENGLTSKQAKLHQMKHSIWSFWATIGFGFILLFAWIVADLFVAVAATIYQMIYVPQTNIQAYAQSLYTNGFILSLILLLRVPITFLLVVLFVFLKKGATIKDYLALNFVSVRVLLVWLGFAILLCPILDGLTTLLDRPVVPEFWAKVYTSAGFLPLLLFGIVFLAPVVEETFFRGFMFRGIEQSRLGPIGAILITTTIWTFIHIQYDWFEMLLVFTIGIFLGVARARTNSIYVTIAIHSLINLIAAIEMIIVVQRSGIVG
jgi:uncharacterized protein